MLVMETQTTPRVLLALPQIMHQRRIKVVELARLWGVDPRTARSKIRGEAPLTLDQIGVVLTALDIQPNDLFVRLSR